MSIVLVMFGKTSKQYVFFAWFYFYLVHTQGLWGTGTKFLITKFRITEFLITKFLITKFLIGKIPNHKVPKVT